MKTKLYLIISVSLLMACGSPNANNEAKASEKSDAVTQQEPVKSTNKYVAAYIQLKDALVATNNEQAKSAAQTLANLDQNDESIKSLAQAIAAESDIEVQREKFFELTEAFIDYAKANDLGEKLYVQFCPMAFNNTGASWVSLSSEIRNPYFGNKMLKCGRVKEEI